MSDNLIQEQLDAAKLIPKNVRFEKASDDCKVIAENLSKHNTERLKKLFEATKLFSNSIRDTFPDEVLNYLNNQMEYQIIARKTIDSPEANPVQETHSQENHSPEANPVKETHSTPVPGAGAQNIPSPVLHAQNKTYQYLNLNPSHKFNLRKSLFI